MDFSLYCNLCGCALSKYDSQNRYSHSWLKHFRAIYSSPAGISVSGVGLYDEGVTSRCIAPPQYTARWNDPGYTFPQDDEIGVLDRKPVNGRYGFVFHEACWSLLEHSYDPEQVPIARLYEVCRSLPLRMLVRGVAWGYTFGGVWCLDYYGFDPREDGFPCHSLNTKDGPLPWTRNPCVVPEIISLLEGTPEGPLPRRTCHSCPASGNGDVFSSVPQEIRDTVAALLSTADICRLRLASRTFVSTFSSQHFWRSRFQPGGERSWLGEIQGLPAFSNWCWLYDRTKRELLPPELLNRQRVNGLILQIHQILNLRSSEVSVHCSQATQMPVTPWREVSADLRPRSDNRFFDEIAWFNFDQGCRLLHTQTINIPERLAQVSFSLLDLNGKKYVTGMRVTADDGTTLSIGYSADKAWFPEPVTNLNGFKLAIGSRGVQGIQVMHGDGRASQWFGSPEIAPHTQRLVCSKGIAALEAGFDGFKMVRLSVQEAAQPDPVEPNHEKSLLHTALWYPDLPQRGLPLSDAQNSTPRPDYVPLLWTHFGGPAGIYLRRVCGILVKVVESDLTIRHIQVLFETKVPDTCSRAITAALPRDEDIKVINFPIDGPGGEIIERVRTSEAEDSCMGGFKITTNWGRSCQFGFVEDDALYCEALEIPVGNTITGFYVGHYFGNGLTGIGVLSELVDRN
ncbi:hypothetical protein P168DRAFT_307768 [Aspergillus campestris IBT 28561]|uniref:F-box domain-containing protein n=1 Tax=Aspergillus campestris (strain IBT 28561) TaxID=1392248 RepID=A0A2I1CR92_ASPC2|nr:uncharacterized protein P168DRAFT_307768 [Aspergillus campestris IBT 28561]PKY00137.1 hypothetical protein P168DRAFT_307768 [Aspergillus campestris IBT 28561]